jgi:signal transduction histidine kinase
MRQITVTLGSSSVWPPSELNEFTFSAKLASENDIFDKPEWGNGEKGYVWIKVHDTGRGMNKDEQKNLFARFSQASPRRFHLDHVTTFCDTMYTKKIIVNVI